MRPLAFALLALPSATPLLAQQAPNGTVTGHVIFSDTRRPARFVQVQLIPRPEPTAPQSILSPSPANRPPARPSKLDGRTAFDGTFNIPDVPPGDYFPIAISTGYIFPITRVTNDKDAADVNKLLSEVPVLHVAASQTSTADISLRLGASIAGRVEYDDGQPAADVIMNAVPEAGFGKESPDSSRELFSLRDALRTERTDEQGRFRILGLRPGKYRVEATLNTENSFHTDAGINGRTSVLAARDTTLTFFAPGTMHRSEAKLLELRDGEQSPDTLIRVGLNALHTLSGRALPKEGLQPIPGTRVGISNKSEKDGYRFSLIQPNGTWSFSFLPAGTYVLAASAFTRDSDQSRAPSLAQRSLHLFSSPVSTVILLDRDLTVDDLLLSEQKPTPPKAVSPPPQ